MIFYFKNKTTYLYPSNEQYEDSFTEITYDKHYNYSTADSIKPSLEYMEAHHMKQACCVVPIEYLSANYGNEEGIDKKYCDANEIPYFYINRTGGTIVMFPGNIIGDAIYATDSVEIVGTFINDIFAFLSENKLTPSFEGNDILIDNKKIIGISFKKIIDGYYYFGVSISINTDIELINKICTKPMKKIPGALSDYGITTEKVMNWLLEWFNVHQDIGEGE